MLYIFHGTDTAKVRAKAHSLIDTLQKKRPDAEVFWMDSETFASEKLKELTESQGLFSLKYIVVLNRVFENKDAKQAVLEAVSALAQAEHVFVMVEEAFGTKEITAFQKHATQMVAYDAQKTEKQTFNTFSLSDALGARDKKKLWMLYIQAKDAGVSDEEIHGVLWWQAKSMMLASTTKSAEEAGLKPFVFSKAKKFAVNFSGTELPRVLADLMELYHRSRRGEYDLGTALEAWILK